MENAGQELRDELQKPKKKKFMTPERKKKLRQVFPIIHRPLHLVPHPNPNSFQLLMREAAKQLKIEQEKKEAERRKVLKIPNKNSHKHDHLAIMTTIFR